MTSSDTWADFDGLIPIWQEALTSFHKKDYDVALRLFDEMDRNLGEWMAKDDMVAAWLGLVANNAFLSAYETSRFPRALYYANRECALARRDAPVHARALNNQGLALLELGRLLEAEACFQEALKILGTRKDDELISFGIDAQQLRVLIQRHLALLSDTRRETKVSLPEAASRPLLKSADYLWGISNSTIGGVDQAAADIVNRSSFEAQRVANSGDFSRAAEVCAAALGEVRNRTRDAKALGIALSNLGYFSLRAGDASRAVEHLEESANLLSQTTRPSEPLARTLHNLSEALLANGQEEEALETAQRAWLEIKEVAPDTPQAIQVLHQLAKLRLFTQDFQRARAALAHAMQIYDASRQRFADSESGHAGVFSVYRSLVELMLLIAVNDQWPDEAMTLVENAKARFWNDHLRRLL